MAREIQGEFEHQVLLALLRLGESAYSAPIVLELEERTGRPVKSAAVYIALRRLENKGLVRSRMVSPEGGGGRDRRYFGVTHRGLTGLREARATYQRLWDGLDAVMEETA